MPLYDYVCECGEEFESLQRIADRSCALCPRCGKMAKQIIKNGHGGITLFRPGWWRDIDYRPLYIETPQQLRRELDARDASAPLLEDGIWRTSPEATKEEITHGES